MTAPRERAWLLTPAPPPAWPGPPAPSTLKCRPGHPNPDSLPTTHSHEVLMARVSARARKLCPPTHLGPTRCVEVAPEVTCTSRNTLQEGDNPRPFRGFPYGKDVAGKFWRRE